MLRATLACLFGVLAATTSLAQAPLPVYTDHLVNGFQDWGWATLNYTNTSPVHSGSNSISVTMSSPYQGMQVYHPDLDSSLYGSITFWMNGGTTGGQHLQLYGLLHAGSNQNASGPTRVSLSAPPANAWQQYTVSFTALGVVNMTNFTGFVIQGSVNAAQPTFYVDDIQLTPVPAPALSHLAVNTGQVARRADARWAAVNIAVWDGNFDTATTKLLLRAMGANLLRFPGGSLSDDYHWASNTTGTNTWTWATPFSKFVDVATNAGAQAMITVNYGSSTASEAAAWVRCANITNHLGFKYWEIGNECYGTWETDTNANAHDPYTYAVRAAGYLQQMRAVDPTIKIGVVSVPEKDSSSNGYTNHPATNLITGQVHYGWTPVMLSTLKGLGVTPDFLIYHRYPEYSTQNAVSPADSDPLLFVTSIGWAADAAELRQEITDYFGAGGTNIELVCTENNSDAGAQGRQSTSLVNGLYYADSRGHLMQTEFNAYVWWDLRNGTDTTGSFDPTLYGWRTYGDLGMINGLNTLHPTYYAAKLMQFLAHSGDAVLSASSDYPLLSVFAAQDASGAVSVLVLNKDTTTGFTAQLALNGFVPSSSAVLRSYGIPQDQAARTNGTLQAQDIATNTFAPVAATFTNTYPPLSMSLFTFSPAAPTLTVLPEAQTGGALVLQLQGQPNVRYVLQSSTNLTAWASIVTNTLTGTTLNLTNPAPKIAAKAFWRALWQP